MRLLFLSGLFLASTALAGERPSAGPDAVDLAALYYYAEQKQEDRLEAEAARLRVKYPDFVVPADIHAPASGRVDETALWSLYKKDDFAGIEAEIARRRLENPEWTPSADFSAKLALRKRRAEMTAAVARKDWPGVVAAARGLDAASEKEIDLVWMLIDAAAATGAKETLAAAYRGLLAREGAARLSDDEILTTLRKATRDFPAAEVREALARFAATPALKAAAGPIELDLIRKEVADFNAGEEGGTAPADDTVARLRAAAGDGDLPLIGWYELKRKAPKAAAGPIELDLVRKEVADFNAGEEGGTAPAEDTVARLRAAAEDADLSLLGWYELKRKAPKAAEPWFRKALSVRPDAENAKGLYLALAAQDRLEEAQALILSHVEDLAGDPAFLLNALSPRFSEPGKPDVDAETMTAYGNAILTAASADHAEILAWYAYNSRQYEAAKAWFGKSLDWESAPARVKGLALSLRGLGDKAGSAALEEEYRAIYPAIWDEIRTARAPKKRRAVAVEQPAAGGGSAYLAHFRAKRYGACVAEIAALRARGALSADAALVAGWCHLGLDRLAEARNAFEAALGDPRTRQDAAYGAALTLLRGRLTDEAEAILARHPLSEKREREVRAEIYWQRARSAFDHRQYRRVLDALDARARLVAEPADLSQLRGWAHYHLGNRREARAVFERLDMHLHDAAAARGLAVLDAQR